MFGKHKQKRFEKLFQQHLDSAYNLAKYLCGNAYDAEDIVQEAYLRAYRAFDEYTNDNSRAWIMTITRNTCHSWMRRNSRNLDIPFDEKCNSMEGESQTPNSANLRSPESITESDTNQRLIRNAIESLPIEFREVAILRELEGLSYLEIGQILDIPKGTVMSRIARSRGRLRLCLANMKGWETP